MIKASSTPIYNLKGRRFVSIHVASNQIELIFDDEVGKFNPSVKLFGEYLFSSEVSIFINRVPHLIDELVVTLNSIVTMALLDESGDMEIHLSDGKLLRVPSISDGQIGFEVYI